MSTPMTLPLGPTTCAAMKHIFPVPLPEIEHRLAFAQILAGIAATVIAFDDFLRNDLEIFGIVIDRATKFRFRSPARRRRSVYGLRIQR